MAAAALSPATTAAAHTIAGLFGAAAAEAATVAQASAAAAAAVTEKQAQAAAAAAAAVQQGAAGEQEPQAALQHQVYEGLQQYNGQYPAGQQLAEQYDAAQQGYFREQLGYAAAGASEGAAEVVGAYAATAAALQQQQSAGDADAAMAEEDEEEEEEAAPAAPAAPRVPGPSTRTTQRRPAAAASARPGARRGNAPTPASTGLPARTILVAKKLTNSDVRWVGGGRVRRVGCCCCCSRWPCGALGLHWSGQLMVPPSGAVLPFPSAPPPLTPSPTAPTVPQGPHAAAPCGRGGQPLLRHRAGPLHGRPRPPGAGVGVHAAVLGQR